MVFTRKWTQEEEQFIMDNYENPNFSLNEIYTKLNKSKKSVCHKASRLGLHRPRSNIDRKSMEKMSESDRKIRERAYYQKNKNIIINKRRINRRKMKREFVNILGGKCKVCGENRLPCLDFHHPNKDKEKEVSLLLKNENRSKILKEVNKCIILCANCHRIEHYKNIEEVL